MRTLLGQIARGGALLVTICLVCPSLLVLSLPSVALAENHTWSLSIVSVEQVDELHTTQYGTNYDGSVEEYYYDDIPSEGNCYALVGISATKHDASALAPIDLSQLKLNIEDESYDVVVPVSLFLKNHGYAVFPTETIASSGRGFVAFEIPVSFLGSTGFGWSISCGDVTSGEFTPAGDEIEWRNGYIAEQESGEAAVLEQYEGMGGATITSPFVVRDLYGTAPLTAVALFESNEAGPVEVTVHGKDAGTDVSYTIQGDSAYHEVPIFGLYPGYENTVTLRSGDEEGTVLIQTQPLPDYVETVSKTASNGAQEPGQLFLLQSPHQVIFDNNGDVRWYLSEEWSCKRLTDDSSYPMTLSPDGKSFYYVRNRLTSSVYSEGGELVHMDWLGRVERVISGVDFQCDHDMTLVDDDTMLYIEHGVDNRSAIKKLDLSTGMVEDWLTFGEVFDTSALPSYADAWGDLWHPNSLEYVPQDGSVIISVRNQSMVLKVDYETAVVEWAFTPASGVNADGSTWARQSMVSDRVVLPSEGDGSFEWFYNPHHASVISYDETSGIMELALFDNGTYRYNFGDVPNNEKYSRMVAYEIDESAKSVRQVYSYGEGRGEQLYSWWYGSAQRLENGHFVGNFALFDNTNNTHIVEADSEENLIAEYQVNGTACGSYRTIVLSTDGAFDELALGDTSGSETYVYEKAYWDSASLEGEPALEGLSVLDLFRDDGSISILGSAHGASGVSPDTVELVASGEAGAFSFPLIVNWETAHFYGMDISLDTLPDGTYSLYVRGVFSDGSVQMSPLDKSVSVGVAPPVDVSVTNILPSPTQESILESLTSSALLSTFESMQVVQDPFGMSPLTAIALFHTDDLSSVHVTVHGKTPGSDVSYEVEGSRLLHEIPIVGLYYDDTSEVTVELTHEDGFTEAKTLSLTTGKAPNTSKIPSISVDFGDGATSDIAPGLTFCAPSGGSYYYAVDRDGAIRWYYAFSGNVGIDGVSFTSNDHLLILDGSKSSSAETNSFSAQEVDLLGRVYNEYYLPNMSFHHELKELPDGNLIASATDYTKKTINDVIVLIDRETGEVLHRWDMDEILGQYGIPLLATPSYELPVLRAEDGTEYNENWFHNNSVVYSEDDDSLIVSSRHLSAVIKIDASSEEIRWVLSDPDCLMGTGLEDYLLTPFDANGSPLPENEFEWQYGQHAPMVCANGDIALFDNGNYRSKLIDDRVYGPDNYSRIATFRIDEAAMTVSLVEDFGEDLGSAHYCALIGDVDELDESHYLGTFGGHCLTGAGGEVSDSSGAPYMESSLYEIKNGKVVWSLSSTPNAPVRSSAIYRAERIELTSLAYTYDENSGALWLGDAAETPWEDIDSSGFVPGLPNVSVSKVTNEGNRIVLSGMVTNPVSVSKVYVGVSFDGNARLYPVEVNERGAFSKTITFGLDQLGCDRELSLYAEMSDGALLSSDPGVAFSGLGTFSTRVVGERKLRVGDSSQLSLSSSPLYEGASSATWSSSDDGVASVDSNGKVTAQTPGMAIITAVAADSGVRSQAVVEVSGVALSSEEIVLRRNEIYQMGVLSVGSGVGDQIWESSDPSVATVDSEGNIEAVEVGETTISATLGEKTLTSRVRVVNGIQDGVYTIASRLDESMVLDIANGSADSQANLQIFKDNGSSAQQFQIAYEGEGMYSIRALCSDLLLDVAGGGVDSGTNVWQFPDNATLAQRWFIEDKNGDGYWTITSALNGMRIDVAGASAINGTNVWVFTPNGSLAQDFRFDTRFSDGIYRIASSKNNDYVLDIAAGVRDDCANVQLYEWNRSSAQMMLIRYAGRGGYEIRPLCSGAAIDVAAAGTDNGTNVQQYTANGTDAQLWYLRQEIGSSSFTIVSAASGKCLDISGGVVGSGTNIQIWDQNQTSAQSFDLIPCSEVVSLVSAIDESYALDISAGLSDSGTNVQLWKRNGTSAQKFFLSDVVSGGYRFILPVNGANSLDVANGDMSSGANVWQWGINGSNAQKWYFSYFGDGEYGITSALSRMWLDVSAGVAADGSNIQVWERNGSLAQRFKILK